ncbi:MAG: hypothetical protein V2J24_05550 [Pseudomonadales bacterium]|nr:hypothetical protein [Pseudomonadales bacterium]
MDPSLWDCVARDWSPRIGDPHFMGWLTVLAYAVTAGVAGRTALAARRGHVTPSPGLQALFWLGVSLLYALLAVNKQLDLQTAMTTIGRCLAYRDGWYEARRGVQIAFIVGFACTSAIGVAVLAWCFRSIFASNRLAFLGIMITVTFVLVRAAGFHGMDQFIGTSILGLRMNWVVELSGIMLVLAATILALRHAQPQTAGQNT